MKWRFEHPFSITKINKVGNYLLVSQNEITQVFKIVDIFSMDSPFLRVQINTEVSETGLLNDTDTSVLICTLEIELDVPNK